MTTINQTLINIENSVFGVSIFGQDVFLDFNTNPIRPGLYYTKIFDKNDTEVWHRLAWADNVVLTGPNNTITKMKVEIRTRTGNELPIKDFTTNTRYTLDELNSLIETNSIDDIDTIFDRATLNRSIISDVDASGVTSTNINYERLGTAYNSFRLVSASGESAGVTTLGTDDTIWNYWSQPIINTPSYITGNRDYKYLQARISLQSNDNITLPKMFRINFTSILKSSFTATLTV